MKEDKLNVDEVRIIGNSMEGIADFLKSYEAEGIRMELERDYVSREYLREKVSALLRLVDRIDYVVKED